MPSASASRTSTGYRMSAPKLVTSLSGLDAQVECLTLRPDQAGVEERQGISTDLHPSAGALEARDDVGGIDGLRLLTADARPHPEQTVGRVGVEHAVVRDAVREDVADRDLEGDREDVEAREHVFRGRTARAWDSAEIARVQVDQVEDSLLIELIGIVELAGDDPPAVRKGVDEGVDESLIVETHFTARGIPGIVTLEGAETVDEPIGLRAVVVREDREILAK